MSPHDMTETPRHSVSVAAVIFDESGESVLLIKRRDNGHWEPPGGVLELEESIEAGLRREVREETGAEIAGVSLTGVYKNMTRGIVALVFRAVIASEHVHQTGEAAQVEWRKISELQDLVHESYAVRVRDALGTGGPHVRAHDGLVVIPEPPEQVAPDRPTNTP